MPTPETSYREAMSELIAERFEKLWKTIPAAIEASDPEAVHDVRVASRRLRAAMDVAVECFPRPWYRKLHRTVKEITSALGEVRDREVLIAFFAEEIERAPAEEKAGIQTIIDRLAAELAGARERMADYLTALYQSGVVEESMRRFAPVARPERAEVG